MSVGGISNSNQVYFSNTNKKSGADLAANPNAGARKTPDTNALSDAGADAKPIGITHDLYVGKYSNVSVSSLNESFSGYDNSKAVMGTNTAIDKKYSSAKITQDMLDTLERTNNAEDLKFNMASKDDVEAHRTQAIDKWLKGEATFNTFMLGGISSNGFRVLETEENRHLFAEAGKALDSDASEEDIANRKELEKQISALTPSDFSWMDCTGLQALTLEERDEFRDGMNSLLREAGIEVDVGDIGFDFEPNGDISHIGGKISEETAEQIMNMFNKREGLSEDSVNLVEKLKEFGKRNGEMNFDILDVLA